MKASHIVIMVAVGAVAFVVAQKISSRIFRGAPQREAREQFQEMQNEARKKYPEEPAVSGLSKVGAANTARDLEAEADPAKRQRMAADIFVGFHALNMDLRPAHCKRLGISIEPFTTAFESAHLAERAKTREVYATHPEVTEKAVVAAIRPQLNQLIMQDMIAVAALAGGSAQEACEYVAGNARALVEQIAFGKVQPLARKSLLMEP
jgi:hypothetical protein